jgi:hypothetical protein
MGDSLCQFIEEQAEGGLRELSQAKSFDEMEKAALKWGVYWALAHPEFRRFDITVAVTIVGAMVIFGPAAPQASETSLR